MQIKNANIVNLSFSLKLNNGTPLTCNRPCVHICMWCDSFCIWFSANIPSSLMSRPVYLGKILKIGQMNPCSSSSQTSQTLSQLFIINSFKEIKSRLKIENCYLPWRGDRLQKRHKPSTGFSFFWFTIVLRVPKSGVGLHVCIWFQSQWSQVSSAASSSG